MRARSSVTTNVSTFRAYTTARTKSLIAALAVCGVLSRLAVVAIAFAIARSDLRLATALGIATTALALVQRVVASSARVAVECDAFNATTTALLHGDVLEVSSHDLRRTVGEGMYYAQDLLGATLPLFVADLLATIILAPVVASAAPARMLVLVAVALALVLAVVFVLRRATSRVQAQFLDARTKLHDTFSFAIEGRLELVARGAEMELRRNLSDEVDAYARLARRSTIRSALLGRAPLAAGIVAVAVVIALDGTSREAVVTAVMSSVLVLGACVPPALGVVLGAHALTRGLANVASLVRILSIAPRPDVATPLEEHTRAPNLPAVVRGERLSFRYDEGASYTFEDVSFEWRPDEPLVLTGPNGSGKSTLLRLLIGLRPPTKGSIRIAGEELQAINLTMLRRSVAYVPQRPYLGEPHVTIREAMRFNQPSATDGRMMDALGRMALVPALGRGAEVLERLVGELSVGQRQRVALARTLLQDARIFLFDEPDANLDRDGVALIVTMVNELLQSNCMVAVAAHTRELAELSSSPIRLDRTRDEPEPSPSLAKNDA